MAKSVNYESRLISTKDAEIKFGHIHNDEVKSSLMIGGNEALEYISFDQTEPRKRWLTSRCRGRYQVKAGDDIPKGEPGIYFDAVSSDIVIRTDGRIRIQAQNIDMIANGPDNENGVINIQANESINLKSKVITANATENLSMVSDGEMLHSAINIMKLYGGSLQKMTARSVIKPPIVPILEKLQQFVPPLPI